MRLPIAFKIQRVLFFSFAFITIFVLAYILYHRLEDSREIENELYKEKRKHIYELQEQNKLLQDKIEVLTHKFYSYQNRVLSLETPKNESSAIETLDAKISTFELKINSLDETTKGLRQAINPMKPDEVLTIVRLKDELQGLSKNSAILEENLKIRQQSFEESIRHEIDSSNQSTTLIIGLLIPLFFNFLYNVWKDIKKPSKQSKENEITYDIV